MEDYKKFWLTNLYEDLYYSIINQNYIIFLQSFLKHYKINYVFCDGIENMFLGLDVSYDKTHLIKSESYWGYKEDTFRNWLIKRTDSTFWEYNENWESRSTQHPNTNGYKLIGDELYNFIQSIKW